MKDKYNKDLLNLLDREVRKVEVENKIRAEISVKTDNNSNKSIVKPPKSRSSNPKRLLMDDPEVVETGIAASVEKLRNDNQEKLFKS